MINKHLDRELDNIKKKILKLFNIVEGKFKKIQEAINTMDRDIAEDILKSDYEVDEMEVEIEEDCLKLLALYQPVAIDLRFIIVIIKVNNELERIGDETANIAKRIIKVNEEKSILERDIYDYNNMAQKAGYMLKKSITALIEKNSKLALNICFSDDEVDNIRNEAYHTIKKAMLKYPSEVEYFVNFFLIARHIERIADHSTNIAEEVIYMVEGEIIRHINN